MLNAPIETILRDLDCPLEDRDRIAAADKIDRLQQENDRLQGELDKAGELMLLAMDDCHRAIVVDGTKPN